MDDRIAKSRAQEQRLADRYGGTRNSGSGNGWKRKHDVRTPGFLWECKRTDGKRLSVDVSELEDTRKVAWLEDRLPAFHFEVGGRRYIMFEEADAEEPMGLI